MPAGKWVLQDGWQGFLGLGPLSDDEFRAVAKSYAEMNGWTLDEVLSAQHVYVQEGASPKAVGRAAPPATVAVEEAAE